MNYYLRKKVDFDPTDKVPAYLGCEGCPAEPVELKNGWVWENTYYVDAETMNRYFYQTIHIGKSSMGWRFFLCRYHSANPHYPSERWLDKPIKTLSDWIDLFHKKGNVIYDEDGDVISAEEMIRVITQRNNGENLRKHQNTYDYTERQEFIDIMPGDSTYDLVWSGNDSVSGIIFF